MSLFRRKPRTTARARLVDPVVDCDVPNGIGHRARGMEPVMILFNAVTVHMADGREL